MQQVAHEIDTYTTGLCIDTLIRDDHIVLSTGPVVRYAGRVTGQDADNNLTFNCVTITFV